MGDRVLDQDPGILCSCCDNHTFSLPDVDGISARQRETIEELCKLCLENSQLKVCNS